MPAVLVPRVTGPARGLRDRNKALWCAFVIETPGGKIYHYGDTGYGDCVIFATHGKNTARSASPFFPIGAYEPRWFMQDQHMNPEDAVQAFRDSGAEFALSHHYGTFQLTDRSRRRASYCPPTPPARRRKFRRNSFVCSSQARFGSCRRRCVSRTGGRSTR